MQGTHPRANYTAMTTASGNCDFSSAARGVKKKNGDESDLCDETYVSDRDMDTDGVVCCDRTGAGMVSQTWSVRMRGARRATYTTYGCRSRSHGRGRNVLLLLLRLGIENCLVLERRGVGWRRGTGACIYRCPVGLKVWGNWRNSRKDIVKRDILDTRAAAE